MSGAQHPANSKSNLSFAQRVVEAYRSAEPPEQQTPRDYAAPPKKARGRYTDEFKQEAALLVTKIAEGGQGYTLREAAKKLGISANLLGRWKQEHLAQEALRNLSQFEAEQLKRHYADEAEPLRDPNTQNLVRFPMKRAAPIATTDSNVTPLPETLRDENIDLKSLLNTVWRKKWMVIITVILTMIPVFFIVKDLPARYSVKTLIMIENSSPQVLDFGSIAKGLPADNKTIQSELEVLGSRDLAARVIDHLQLDNDPELNGSLEASHNPTIFATQLKTFTEWLPFRMRGTTKEELNDQPKKLSNTPNGRIVDAFLANLTVSRQEESRVIHVAFQSHSPDTAALVANTLAELYIQGQREAKFDATLKATEWLNQGVASLRDKVEASERAVEQYRQNSGLLGGQRGVTLVSEQISALNAEHVRASTARVEAEARLRQINDLLSAGKIDSAVEVMRSSVIQRLREQELEAVLSSEKSDLQARIAAEIDNIIKSVENEAALARSREASLQASLNAIKNRVADANTATVELRTLEREAEANRLMLESFSSRLKEASSRNDINVQQPNARIISRADVPVRPIASKKKLIVAVALAGSIFAGLLLIFLTEQLQRGFRSGLDVEQTTGVPVIGLVPMLSWRERLREQPIWHVLHRRQSAFSESIRSLYTTLHLFQVDGGPKRILLVSAEPNEGKTAIAVCLARSQALTKQRVVIVDTDIRRPTIHDLLKVPRRPGLVELLAGTASLREVVNMDVASGAHIIPAGAHVSNPPSVLASHRLKAVFDDLAKRYDLIIVDSPPLMAVSDARLLTATVDLTVLVLRWGHTDRKVVKLALEQIRSAGGRVAGILLSMVDLKKNSQYGYGDSAMYNRSARKYYTSKAMS